MSGSDWLAALLEDLRDGGAASRGDVEAHLREAGHPCTVEDLVALGEIAPVYTDLGTLYVLGPRGKRRLGVRSSWITRPEAAVDQFLGRRVRARLEASGWVRDGRGGLPFPRYRMPDGRSAYVVVKGKGPRSSSLRRILRRHRTQLIREGAVLTVFTPDHWRFKRVEEDGAGLLCALPLDLPDWAGRR